MTCLLAIIGGIATLLGLLAIAAVIAGGRTRDW